MNAKQYGKDGSALLGERAERTFQQFMEERGWKVSEANFSQNVHEHWDFFIEKNEHSYKVDVKSAKKISRSDNEVQFKQLWVELANVRGNKGWLYGEADFIVFQLSDGFSFIRRSTLEEIVHNKISDKKVTSSSEALYNRYTRKGRKDVITIINYGDIKEYCKEL